MLTSVDYLLMKKIKKHQPISAKQLKARCFFKIDGIHTRLNTPLIQYSFIDFEYIEQNVGYGISAPTPTDRYVITELGLKALQDYKVTTREEKHKLRLKSCWIPIIVSIAINEFYRLIPYIRYWLKLIQEWISK